MKELASLSSPIHLDIRISLLSCLAAVKASGSTGNKFSAQNGIDLTLPRSCHGDSIYNLALDLHGYNLRLAAALASYATISVKKNTDPLLVAETWDYLCNAVLSAAANQHVTQGTVSDDTDDIAQICEGLAVLLSRADTKICERLSEMKSTIMITILYHSPAGFLLSSPLTLSFVDTLKRLPAKDVDADEQRSNPYTRLFDKARSCSQFRPSAADIVILRSWPRCRKFVLRLRGKVKMKIEI